MKYSEGFLSELDFLRLKNLVATSLLDPNNPKLGRTNEYLADSTFFRTNNNIELVKFINSITGYSTESINSFFYVRYNVGDKLPRHRDRSNHDVHNNPEHSISYSFLISMCEEGGDFLLNDSLIDFKTPGKYISFDGQDIFHEITEIKKGTREVLVIWYRPETKKSIL